jgi:hypothetical protein
MKSVKETVLNAFNELQSDPVANIVEWGRNNPKDFYNIAAKLIPIDLKATVDQQVTIPAPSQKRLAEIKAKLEGGC